MSTLNIGRTLGAAFFGYTIGAVLLGMTITQAYHYFTRIKGGTPWQQATVVAILIADGLHFAFAVHMMYSYLIQVTVDSSVAPRVVWSLKAMGSTQVFFTIFVQALYLHKMWLFASAAHSLLSNRFRLFLKIFVCVLGLLAIGVGILFLVELQKIDVISSFSLEFEYVIYVGFGTTALIDMGIAAAMCLMLHKSRSGTRRGNEILSLLIQYLVGTGLLTSLGALLIMILYISNPDSLFYLGVEYSMTRLYAISVLALNNSQGRLRDKFNETREVNGKSLLYFAGPEKVGSHMTVTRPSPSEDPYDLDGTQRHPRREDTLSPSLLESQYSPEGSEAHRPLNRGRGSVRTGTVEVDPEHTLVQPATSAGRPVHVPQHRSARDKGRAATT